VSAHGFEAHAGRQRFDTEPGGRRDAAARELVGGTARGELREAGAMQPERRAAREREPARDRVDDEDLVGLGAADEDVFVLAGPRLEEFFQVL